LGESYLLSDIREVADDHYELVFNRSLRFDLVIDYPGRHLLSRVVRVSM